MSGWFKVYRDIFDSDLWHDVTTFRLFMYLLGQASHQNDVKSAGVTLQRGQWLRSYRKLAEDLSYKEGRGLKQYSSKTIKKCVDKLIKDERVTVQETEVGTLFTITNYAVYQGFEDAEKETGNGTSNEVETNGKRRGNNNKNARMQEDKKNSVSRHKYEICDMDNAKLLFNKMQENNPNTRTPNLDQWANDFRLLRERDQRENEEIQDLIIWSQNHDFWYTNILSPKKLRQQWDKLILQYKKSTQRNYNHYQPSQQTGWDALREQE